jgi:uncharacterized integral membrane protein
MEGVSEQGCKGEEVTELAESCVNWILIIHIYQLLLLFIIIIIIIIIIISDAGGRAVYGVGLRPLTH